MPLWNTWERSACAFTSVQWQAPQPYLKRFSWTSSSFHVMISTGVVVTMFSFYVVCALIFFLIFLTVALFLLQFYVAKCFLFNPGQIRGARFDYMFKMMIIAYIAYGWLFFNRQPNSQAPFVIYLPNTNRLYTTTCVIISISKMRPLWYGHFSSVTSTSWAKDTIELERNHQNMVSKDLTHNKM